MCGVAQRCGAGAWAVVGATTPGAWRPHGERLLRRMQTGVPAEWQVVVLADRGLYAPWLFRAITALGWHPGPRLNGGAGSGLFFLPAVTLPAGCSPRQTDLLFYPTPRDGYPSRLFFADRIQSPMTLNWNGGTYAIERNWYAFSLRIEASGLRLLQTVKAHLRALGK